MHVFVRVYPKYFSTCCVCFCLFMYSCFQEYLSRYLCVPLPIYPFTHLPIYSSIHLSIYPFIDVSIYLSIYVSMLSMYFVYLFMDLCRRCILSISVVYLVLVCLSMCSIYFVFCLFVCLPIFVHLFVSLFLSIYFICLSMSILSCLILFLNQKCTDAH